MASGTLTSVVRYLRRVTGGPAAEEPTDGQLLERFIAQRDQAAFALLLERHGAMVLGVCGRVLDDPNDVDDAFQASFLVLVRKASSIRKTESLASWLYGVAQRTAHKARCTAALRRTRERQVPNMPNVEPAGQASWSDLRPVLDEELGRLPEKYRAPLVLCYLEGKTNEEAARQLGWTKGTVSGRLARAREILRGRLSRRGITIAGSVLATLLMQQSASALVPPTLAGATLKAAVAVAAGQSLAVSTSVAILTEGVMRAMFVTKLKIAALVVFTIGVIGAGTGMLAARGGHGSSEKHAPAADGDKLALLQEKEQTAKPAADSGKDDKELIQGLWNLADFEGGKEAIPPDFKEKFKLLFDNGKLFGLEGGSIGQGTYAIDPSKKPRTLDLKVRDEQGVKAIYTLDGDTLKICAPARPDSERPTEFKSGDDVVVLIMKREKSAEKVAAFRKSIKDSPDGGARARSTNNLKQIALAMHNYHSTFNHFPPAATYDKDGKPLLSWRVLILPFIEQDALYRAFKLDEPWDSENNKKLIAQMPKVYAPVGGVETKEKHMTFYQVFTGKGTIFEGSKALKIQDILDGTSNTALVVEAGEPVIWTKPDDLPYDENKPLPKLGGLFKGAFNMAMADGSVRFVKAKFDEKILRLIITRADGTPIDFDSLDKE
jgi:RNA polymerase sigma factor (sigma-70 family)